MRNPSGPARVLLQFEAARSVFMREQDSRSYPVRENMRLQYAFWAWERATWVALALIVLLALSGLFAHGPLSRRTVKDAALSLTYERFQRVTSVARLTRRSRGRPPMRSACG